VLQLIDHGETTEGTPYVVTELLEGYDLEDAIAARGPLPEPVLLDIAMQSLSAFETAHGMSVVHRDIKPGNLFLCHNARLVVLDFGLARAINKEVSSTLGQSFGTKILGTPQYWSPEQIKGVTLDMKSDIFSLGGTLYFLCSGQQPYPGNTPFEIAGQIMMKKRKPVMAVAPKLDPRFAAVIERMLAEETEDRPSSADARALFKTLVPAYPNYHEETIAFMRGAGAHDIANAEPRNTNPSLPPAFDSGNDTTNPGAPPLVTGAHAMPTPTAIFKDAATQIATITSVGGANEPEEHTSIVTVASTAPSKKVQQQALSKRGFPTAVIALSTAFIVIAILGGARAMLGPKQQEVVTEVQQLVPPPPTESPNAALPVPTAKVDVPVVPKQPEIGEEPGKRQAQGSVPGTLNCSLKQWAEVFVDGHSIGKQQLGIKLSLAPGKHDLLFKNSKLGERRASFTIKSGKESTCRIDFTSNEPL
jgi:serine/threonine-protein kinase